MQKIIPARLRPGDEIRVIAPASGIKIIGRECREIARRRFEEMGLAVSYGTNAVDENWDAGGSTTVEKKNRRHCRSFRRSESQSGIHHDRRQQLQPAA